MAIEILMPALSPTMEEGTLAKWLVKEGDTVSSGDIMAEIETDKATMEFEAVDEGTIGKILIGDGSEGVKVNPPIAVLLEEGEEASDIDTSAPAPDAKDSAKEDAPDQDAAPEKGYGRGESDANDTGTSAPAAPKGSDGKRLFVTPLARRIAADKGVDLTELSGSGPHGRIIKADVEAASACSAKAKPAESTQTASAPATTAAPAAGPSADAVMKIYEGRAFEEISLNGMRKTIAARLTEAKQSIPHFYLRRDIHLDALLSLRAEINRQLAPREIKLSVNDFIIKACAAALQQVPEANVVIVNPSHYAVALKWARTAGGAPVCVAKGVDEIALRIKEIAYEEGVAVYSDPPTARALFAHVRLDAQILPEHYAAVAVAFRYADALSRKERSWR